MLENHGPIRELALAAWLWLVPCGPLLAAVVLVVIGVLWLRDREEQPKAAAPDPGVAARVALGGAATALVVSAGYGWVLYDRAAGARVLVAHVARMVRLGQLDLGLDLVLDPAGATLAVAVSLAFAAALLAGPAWPAPRDADPFAWRRYAWASALLGGVLLTVVADNVVVLLVGAELAAMSAFALAGERPGRSAVFVVARAGAAFVALGAAILFWSLGGTWTGNDYAPDLEPRYVAVSSAGAGETPFAARADVGDLDEDDEHEHGGAIQTSEDAERRRRAALHVDAEGRVQHGAAEEAHALPVTGKGWLTFASQAGSLLFLDDARTPMMNGPVPFHSPLARAPMNGGIHTLRVHPGGGSDDYLVTHVPFGGDAVVSLVLVGPTLGFRELRDQLVLRNGKDDAWVADGLVAKRAAGGLSAVALACWLFVAGALVWAAFGSTWTSPLARVTGLAGAWLVVRLAPLFALDHVAAIGAGWAGVVVAVVLALSAARSDDDARATSLASAGTTALVITAAAAGAGVGGSVEASTWALAAVLGAVVLGCAAAWARPQARVATAARAAVAAGAVVAAAMVARRGVPLFVGALAGAGLLGAALLRPRSRRTKAAPPSRAGLALAGAGVACALGAAWLVEAPLPLGVAFVVVAVGRVLGGRFVAETGAPSASDRGLGLVAVGFSGAMDRVAGWVIEMDRGVIDALWSGVANLVHAGSWVHGRIDRHVLDAPASGAANRVVLAVGVERAQKIAFALVAVALAAAASLFVVASR